MVGALLSKVPLIFLGARLASQRPFSAVFIYLIRAMTVLCMRQVSLTSVFPSSFYLHARVGRDYRHVDIQFLELSFQIGKILNHSGPLLLAVHTVTKKVKLPE